MTTISSSNPSVETIAGLAAVVGEAEGSNSRVPGQEASGFGALMGFLGQQATGGQSPLPLQDGDSLGDPVSVDVPVDAAVDVAQAPLDDVLMQAMWPILQGQPSLTTEAPKAAASAPQQSVAEVPEHAPEVQSQVRQASQPQAIGAVIARTPQQAAAGADVPKHAQDAPVHEPSTVESAGSDIMAWQRAAYAQSMAMPAPDAAQYVDDDGAQPAPSAAGVLIQGAATNASYVAEASATQSKDVTTTPKFAEQMSSTISRALGDALGENEDALLDDATWEGPTAPDGTMGSFFPAGMMPAAGQPQPQRQEVPSQPVDNVASDVVAFSRDERRAPERAVPGANRQDVSADAADIADIEAQPEAFQQALHGAQNTVAHGATAQQVNQAPDIAQASPVPSVAVSQELSQAITQGARNVQMRIVPEGLGELNIKVQMTGQNVHLTIRGDAPELAQLLGQKVQELRQDLHNQGLSLEAMDFGALSSSHQEASFGQDNGAREFYGNDGDANTGSNGLQRIAGSKETSQVRPTGRVQRAGPKDRIIDVVL